MPQGPKKKPSSRVGKTPERAAPTRREKAQETRRRIVASAYRMFLARGFVGTTMDAVAADAGVAGQTMYFLFRTKTALLCEAFDSAVLGHEKPTPPQETPWYRAFVAEKSAARALALVVDSATEINERVGALLAIFDSLAHDPEATAFYQGREALRDTSYREILRILSQKEGGLRVSPARGADVLYVVLSPDLLRKLRARGWSLPECKRWLTRVLSSELLAAEG